MQFYWSNYQESGLVDIIAALVSLLAMVAFLKIWHPKTKPAATMTNLQCRVRQRQSRRTHRHEPAPLVLASILKGWSPFLLASVFIFVWSMPAIKDRLTLTSLKQPMPYLDRAVVRMPPVVVQPTPEEAIADLNFLALPGTAVLLGGVLAALLLGMSPAADRPDLRPYADPSDAIAPGDQFHGQPGLRHAILRDGYSPRSEPDSDRPCLPLLRDLAGMAGGGPDGHRCGFECALR